MKNIIILTGNVVDEPTIKTLQSGTVVTRFRLAVDRQVAKDAAKKTDFFFCDCWNGVATAVKNHVHKGDLLNVVGAMQLDSKQNDDGSWTNYANVNARAVNFLRLKGSEAQTSEAPESVEASTPAPSEDDIPF